MRMRTRDAAAAQVITGIGAALFLTALVYHLGVEARAIGQIRGPLMAVTLDGLPPLTLVYGGYRLRSATLSPREEWWVPLWCLAGLVVAVAVLGVSIVIREMEGRHVAEPAFVLLISADAGAIAGCVAGYYNARARADAERARRATDTLSFVNGLLRHDIRNGLSVVEGFATAVEDGDARREASAEAIREQVAEMTTLVENAEAIAATLDDDPEFDRVDLAPIVAEACERVADTFDADVVVDAPETATVQGNEALRSVVTNLVENAAEHNDRDDLRIRVSVEATGDAVRLRVADNGGGIPDERKETVFEPSAGHDHGGGLHMVNALVERYGGRIRVEDSNQGGTEFAVELLRADE